MLSPSGSRGSTKCTPEIASTALPNRAQSESMICTAVDSKRNRSREYRYNHLKKFSFVDCFGQRYHVTLTTEGFCTIEQSIGMLKMSF